MLQRLNQHRSHGPIFFSFGTIVVPLLLFTDRVRSTRGGNIFTLCVCPHLGGEYAIRLMGGVSHPRSRWGGGTPSQVQVGGTPSSWWWGGTPSSWWWGGYPIQLMVWGTLAGGPPGVPPPPSRSRWGAHPGYPHPSLGGGPARGTPPIQV